MPCRKDHRDLTAAERTRFIEALYHVKATGVVDQFASDHDTYFHEAHHSSHFLPWHREFLRRFEDALRTYDPDVSIPYWNSTEDTDTTGPLWDNAFLGQFDSAWSLGRSLGGDTLPPPANVTTALGKASFDELWPYVEGVALHNPPHNWTGGVMSTAASPGDPTFYLHHCWIDMIWAQWQLLHPGAAFVESESGRGLNDAMAPWTTTPADVMDHRTINMYHYLPGMQEDVPVVTPDTPAINFIEVPEGETRMQAAVFDLEACEPVHLAVTDGPTVLTGPPATQFSMVASSVVADPRVDSKGRLWIRFTGTAAGDEATGTVTIHCEETNQDHIIALSANTIPRPTAAAVMVLDRSNSMNFDSGIGPGVTRADVLRFSASPVVAVVDDVHALAVCHFDHDPHPGIGMTPVAGGGAVLLNGAISSYAPNPDGWTSIGEGVAFAHDILDPVAGYDVKAMVVLSDGEENHGPHTRRYITDVADLINGLNGHVFAIGLGRPEVLNAGALQALCNGNQGYMVMTGDLTTDASFRLAKYYQQIFAGVTNNEVVRDPDGLILPGQEHRIWFDLNEADINAKAILLSPLPYALSFTLETPAGDVIDPGVAAVHPMAELDVAGQVALYRVGLPIPLGPNEAHVGRWHVVLKVNDKYPSTVGLAHGFGTGGLPAAFAVHGLPYSVNVHAYSNLRMKAVLAQTSNEPGATLTVRALLTEYGVPLTGSAHCRAEMERPDGSTTTLSMPKVEPGGYEATTVAAIPGVYRLHIYAEGKTMRGRRFTREQVRTAGVWRGGDQRPPSSRDPGRPDERFCRLIGCLLRQRGIQEMLKRAGVDLDELRHCLDEYCRKSQQPRAGAAATEAADQLKLLLRDDRLFETLLRELQRARD